MDLFIGIVLGEYVCRPDDKKCIKKLIIFIPSLVQLIMINNQYSPGCNLCGAINSTIIQLFDPLEGSTQFIIFSCLSMPCPVKEKVHLYLQSYELCT